MPLHQDIEIMSPNQKGTTDQAIHQDLALGKEEVTLLDQEEIIIGENYSQVVCLELWITEDYTICLKMKADSLDAK